MKLQGRHSLSATRDAVWSALSDLAVLEDCIPGCQSLEQVSDNQVKAVVSVEIGSFQARFTGTITIDDLQPPERWTLRGEGRGRPAGTARGHAEVALLESGGLTEVSFLGQVDIGGKLAEVAAAEIDAHARKLSGQFFSRLEAKLKVIETTWTDQLDHTLAGVPILGDEPSERVVEDKVETAGETVEELERRIEMAAGKDLLGGPIVWGLLTLVVLIVILVLVN